MLLLAANPVFGADVPHSNRSVAAYKNAETQLQPRLEAKQMRLGQNVFIRIFKQENELEVWLNTDRGFELFQTWPIAAFSGRIGPKTRQGDNQAPEGFYFVPPARMNPWSSYHLSFNLGYPNSFDRAYGRDGSFLMVHGDSVSIGCYAMTDPVIEEIWTLMEAAFKNGQPFIRVHAFPFRMTRDNMELYGQGPWQDFWINLKEGFDFFENSRMVPNVTVQNKQYEFE